MNLDKCQAILEMKKGSTIDRKDSFPLKVFSSISLEGATFLCIVKSTILSGHRNVKQHSNYLSNSSILCKPEFRHPLYLYLLVSDVAIAGASYREDIKQQHPVYFISKTLQGLELRYQKLEKVALALVFITRHLRQYFQAHTIVIRIDQPIRQVLQKLDLTRRMVT